jgi:hypothetical protein
MNCGGFFVPIKDRVTFIAKPDRGKNGAKLTNFCMVNALYDIRYILDHEGN